MRKCILLALVLLNVSRIQGQDSTWKKVIIDENIAVSLPVITSQTDTTLIKEGKEYRFGHISAETEYAVMNILSTPGETGIGANNPEALQKALEGMVKGTMNSFSRQGFSCTVQDTVFGKIPARKISCTASEQASLECYLFLLNDKMYAFQAGFNDEEKKRNGMTEWNHLLQSIQLTHRVVKEQEFGSGAEALGYSIGRLAILIIILLVIMYQVFWKK